MRGHNFTGASYCRYVCTMWKKYFANNGAFKRALLEVLDENEKLKIENALLRAQVKEVTYVLVPESEVEK